MTKKTFIILTSIVLLLTAVALGIWLYPRFAPAADVSEYNIYATAQAYSSGLITSQDILILHTIDRSGDSSAAEFYVYRLPTGANADDYWEKDADAIGDELELMGTATCSFVDDKPAAIQNLQIRFIK